MTESDDTTEVDGLERAVDEIDELIFSGELDEAKDAVDEAIDEYGDDDELLLLRAEVALESDDYEACVDAVDNGLETVGDAIRAELLELKGYSLFYLDELDEARQIFNEAIRLGGASWSGLLGRAMVHEEMFFDRAATLDLNRAIDIDDQEAQPFMLRGHIRLRHGDFEEARGDLDYALSIDPDDEQSRLNLARLQAVDGRTSEAIETLEPLVEDGIDADFVLPAALLRSQLSLTLGSAEAAGEDARKAIEIAPDKPWGHLQLAACRISAMDAGEAIAAVKEAEATVDDVDDIPDAHALRASAYDQLGKTDKAEKFRDRVSGTSRLPGIVYGEWLNPAENIPINPRKPIEATTVMEQLFDDPADAPEGYADELREIIDSIPQRLQENPGADEVRIPLPDAGDGQDVPDSLVLKVDRKGPRDAAGGN